MSNAIVFNPIPSPNFDISELGQVGIAGDFNGISLYEFEGQTEQPFSSNGSEQLMTRLPNGVFTNLLNADASIKDMCVFQERVILGGNFTSVDGKQSVGLASFNPTTSEIVPLPGLSGQVSSLLCDDNAGLVYVGGSFRAEDSFNAITWSESSNWTSLPFAGFNGPVNSIVMASTGHIIFGGSFTGLGNTSTPSISDAQTINLNSATISTYQGATAGLNDPMNVICNAGGADGERKSWLLQDGVPGNWAADFGFGFQPTKLRLRNTHLDGRGTRTWMFTARPNNGIMNFTYIDPETGKNMSCTNRCPLSNDSSVEFQDFHFVNRIGMNAFRIDISAWYGQGAGLDSIELYQDDIYTFAINDFNEPPCSNSTTPSESTQVGPWTVTPSGSSNSQYLSATLSKPITDDAASVVFRPDIRESGDYVIKIYTPGCLQDGTCARRGQINIFGTLNTTSGNQHLNQGRSIYQTNEFDKYDQIYFGHVDVASGSFRPSITLSPVAEQSLSSDDMVMVAQRIGIERMNSTGGLNGLFEYDPTKDTVDTSDFDSSAFNKLGSTFDPQSVVLSLVTTDGSTYIGGNFTSPTINNVAALDASGQTKPLDGGLNGVIMTMHNSDGQLFVGGTFTDTQKGGATGLSHVAIFDEQQSRWTALGAGVDGNVMSIVAMTLNLTGNATEEAIALTGDFLQILPFGDNDAVNTTGFAVWVKSQGNWLENLDMPVPLLDGQLATSLLNAPNNTELYAGSISSQSLRAYGVASTNGMLGNFPIKITPPSLSFNNSTSKVLKRASPINNTEAISGVVTGAFDTSNRRNVTVLAGHFVARGANGSTVYNLGFIDRMNSDSVTGLGTELPAESVFLALEIDGDNVFAGGRVSGTIGESPVNGLISYNLATGSLGTQPPVLAGNSVVVSSIAVRPSSSDLYVGGSFDTAGSLPCPAICMLDTGKNQWSRPGFELTGTVHTLLWSSSSTLFVGGQLKINNNDVFLASFDVSSSSWTVFDGASDLPGPVDAITPANKERDKVWVAGTRPDGTVYLMMYDGKGWASASITLGSETVITSLQMFSLTKGHDKSDLIDERQALLLTGSIDIPSFGTASGAIYNGTTLEPYILTSSMNTTIGSGSVSKIFVENEKFFTSSSKRGLALGFIVLIGLAVSLGLMLLIVVAGLALDRYRKKRDGYMPAPTSMIDRGSGMQRVPPHELLDSLGRGRPGAPHV
ncbi:putative cellular morphogenesis protein [Rosellinia necatrix]|uniref:Putative cellular morphogenesis protein n=1 Tax=Rosellinia necatrix TaxID=77044 RepID=A0A1W2TDK0_ROSNE|nr:putative cellular morphogenesis protein [Rosellinia necatrix]